MILINKFITYIKNNLIKEIKTQEIGQFTASLYDLNSIEGINRIKTPRYERICGIQSPTQNIEYILQRKATEHKKNKRMDLAIACLRKSNEIMPYSNIKWQAKDYLRLVKYLENDGQYEEAKRVEKQLSEQFPETFKPVADRIAESNKNNVSLSCINGYDLVVFSSHYPTCGECNKYQGKVFSISGNDKRFPKLPDFIFNNGKIHDGCKHFIFPYIIALQSENEINEAIYKSNLPFIDNRDQNEIELYEKQKKTKIEHDENFLEYEKIKELLPDYAPKSFAGFVRMKKSNSSNYINLINRLKHKF